ncbi:hypothetical protein [Edaphobacter modestus]|uniref:Uncharacterized protein n=1 Tax=Edaphobacter modestus TaxID=388466 RepID=A0A4Q7YWU5_9BACT|nr:hypothetical protein [Edaphobacter modestus]RZU42178.1 hypothetical protein BDD14_3725 [Edaphobacter modestus]
MQEPMPICDERTTTHATGTDVWNILTDEMNSLYLLSFLLTADLDKAGQCFFSGMGECAEEIGAFMAWAQARARRTIVQHAIWMIMPAPERTDEFPFVPLKRSAVSGEANLFGSILRLNAFERFVYVMSVLEKQSDDTCSTLLRCSRRDVMIARALAIERLANTYNPYDPPVEALGAWQTRFANHCA